LLDKYAKLVVKSSNYIIDAQMYGVRIFDKFCDIDIYAHIFFDHKKAKIDELNCYSQVKTYNDELAQLDKHKPIARKFNKIYDINFETGFNQTLKLSYSLNHDKIDDISKYNGFFIFITTDKNITPDILIKAYKNRDVIEKQFNSLKTRLLFKTVKIHNDDTTNGKIFIAFISLILRSCLFNKLKQNNNTNKLTVESAISKLNLFKEMHINDNVYYSTLSKIQKQILSALGMSNEYN
jgi:transposase